MDEHHGATRIDVLVQAGWLLLLAGLAVIGIQALSGIAIEWCIGLKFCSLHVEPKLYRDAYGLVLIGMGAASLVAAAVIDVVAVRLAARPAAAAADGHAVQARADTPQ